MARASRARRVGAIVVLATVALIGLGRPLGRRLLFRGSGRPAVAVDGAVTLHVRGPDGTDVRALELPRPGAKVIVHFHDNTQTAGEALASLRPLHARGFGVVVMEYRGYGDAAGRPSEAAFLADAEALLVGLTARGLGPSRIVLSGRSLGTGVAAELALRGRGAALVLVAPFTSIPDVVRQSVPFAPTGLLVEDAFDTASKSARIGVPTLIVHGDADEIVPFHMGVALAEAIPAATLLRVPGAGHGDVLDRDAPSVLASIAAWADRAGGPSSGPLR